MTMFTLFTNRDSFAMICYFPEETGRCIAIYKKVIKMCAAKLKLRHPLINPSLDFLLLLLSAMLDSQPASSARQIIITNKQ